MSTRLPTTVLHPLSTLQSSVPRPPIRSSRKGREGANHCSPEGGGTVGDGQRYPYAAESWVRCTSSVSSASLHTRAVLRSGAGLSLPHLADCTDWVAGHANGRDSRSRPWEDSGQVGRRKPSFRLRLHAVHAPLTHARTLHARCKHAARTLPARRTHAARRPQNPHHRPRQPRCTPRAGTRAASRTLHAARTRARTPHAARRTHARCSRSCGAHLPAVRPQ